MNNAFVEALESKSEQEWLAAVESLLPSVHEIDRNAVQIWFRFYPLDLVRYLESAEDIEVAMHGISMAGDFGVLDKIDTSHGFLYGHRFWPLVKQAIQHRAESGAEFSGLATEISGIAQAVAKDANADESLTTGIAAVGLMTLVQTGYDEFKDSAGVAEKPSGLMAKSPNEIVKERAKDDSQGIFGFLKTIDKEYTVDFKAFASEGSFKIIYDEEITSAGKKDRARDWQSLDPRCWDGPVPMECTSASCGTCWVGVIAGEEKLSAPSERERRRMKVFGYGQPETEAPIIRLACQAKATGNVTIVIPPWNAVFGKQVRGNVDDVELEPVTTSAKKLRETIASAIDSE